MKNDYSFLHSLVDPFEYTPEKIYAFEEIGYAPMGEYHILTFFRNVAMATLHIDYKNCVTPVKNCTVYNITNNGGTLFGLLFAVNKDSFEIRGERMVVYGNEEIVGDFSAYPFTNERLNINLYRDSSDALLVNIGASDSPFLVIDE